MLYREMGKTGDKVSILGYGCMRFPKKGMQTDMERTERQLVSAIERGVNYFDTAYIYPGSEVALGRILAKTGLRDRVLIATKLPSFLVRSRKDMDNMLATSLDRLQTDHVDYYLMHNLTSIGAWKRMQEAGVEDFLAEAKKAGKIRRIGFSYHGDSADFSRVVDAYPWDFCQIQYNLLDEHFQAGTEGMQYAASRGLGVVVMEPLRGGLLGGNPSRIAHGATLPGGKVPDAARAVWERAGVKRSPAEWALRWVWNHPEVVTVLSGMNEEAHIDENIRAASEALPDSLTKEELALFEEVRGVYNQKTKVGCTGCAYCMPCPHGVNIPACFKYYNDMNLFDDKSFKRKYATMLMGIGGGGPAFASRCRDCGACEKHCPQSLPIRKHLKEVAGEMEPFYLKPMAGAVQMFFRSRKPKKTEDGNKK